MSLEKQSANAKTAIACMIFAATMVVAAWLNGQHDNSNAQTQWHKPPALIVEAKPPESNRSPEWPRVRAEHLKDHPACAVCGRTDGCEVHHVVPFHLDRSKELDKSNLVTLCGPPWNHHFWFGHLGNWQSYNPSVLSDIRTWRAKIASRPVELKAVDAEK